MARTHHFLLVEGFTHLQTPRPTKTWHTETSLDTSHARGTHGGRSQASKSGFRPGGTRASGRPAATLRVTRGGPGANKPQANPQQQAYKQAFVFILLTHTDTVKVTDRVRSNARILCGSETPPGPSQLPGTPHTLVLRLIVPLIYQTHTITLSAYFALRLLESFCVLEMGSLGYGASITNISTRDPGPPNTPQSQDTESGSPSLPT